MRFPAVWALFHFCQEVEVVLVPVLFSLLGRGFVAGWLSSLNTYFHDMIQAIAPNSDFGTNTKCHPLRHSLRTANLISSLFSSVQCPSDQVDLSLSYCVWSRLPEDFAIFVRICQMAFLTRCQEFSVV